LVLPLTTAQSKKRGSTMDEMIPAAVAKEAEAALLKNNGQPAEARQIFEEKIFEWVR